jgi:hypothetical protein
MPGESSLVSTALPITPGLMLAVEAGSEVGFVAEAGYQSVAILVAPDLMRAHFGTRQCDHDVRMPCGVEILQADALMASGLFKLGRRLTESRAQGPADGRSQFHHGHGRGAEMGILAPGRILENVQEPFRRAAIGYAGRMRRGSRLGRAEGLTCKASSGAAANPRVAPARRRGCRRMHRQARRQVDATLQLAVGEAVTRNQRSQRMAGGHRGAQPLRLLTSAEATRRELRLCGFALLNHYLTMHHVLAEQLHVQPVDLLILVATTTGNVQRDLRPEGLPEAFRGSKWLPPGVVVPMSRRAIARITGLPKETVRRHVEGMVKRGILVSVPGGVLAPNRLTEPWAAVAARRLIESHVACTERLIALQAIAPQSPQSARTKRA